MQANITQNMGSLGPSLTLGHSLTLSRPLSSLYTEWLDWWYVSGGTYFELYLSLIDCQNYLSLLALYIFLLSKPLLMNVI